MASPVIQVRIPEDVVIQVQKLADEEKLTVSSWVRRLIMNELLRAGATPLVNVKDFGAKGDGKTKDTAAIKKAVETAFETAFTPVFCNRGSCTGRMVTKLGQPPRCSRCNQKSG